MLPFLFLIINRSVHRCELYMRLYKLSELKKLSEGDKIYLKYLELPIDKEGSYEGVCEVIVNNDELLTTNTGINFYYPECGSDYANVSKESGMIQIYEI